MPVLPSGLDLAVGDVLVVDAGTNWFSCPEGHLWFQKPDPNLSPPKPWPHGVQAMCDFKSVPLPETLEEMYEHLAILTPLEECEEGRLYWNGFLLGEALESDWLDATDKQALRAWLQGDETLEFLKGILSKWKTLVARAVDAQGYAVFSTSPPDT